MKAEGTGFAPPPYGDLQGLKGSFLTGMVTREEYACIPWVHLKPARAPGLPRMSDASQHLGFLVSRNSFSGIVTGLLDIVKVFTFDPAIPPLEPCPTEISIKPSPQAHTRMLIAALFVAVKHRNKGTPTRGTWAVMTHPCHARGNAHLHEVTWSDFPGILPSEGRRHGPPFPCPSLPFQKNSSTLCVQGRQPHPGCWGQSG